MNCIASIIEINAPKYEKEKLLADDSPAYGAITPYAGLLVIPPAIMNSSCNACFLFISLHKLNPQIEEVNVIMVP